VRPQAELAVLVACHSFLVAIPAKRVARLVLPEEVSAVTGPSRGALLGSVRAGDRVCAAWDLGVLLELESLDRAWVVLDGDGRGTPVALRTGVCALVAEVTPETSLPGRIFRRRAQAFPAAFAAESVDARLPALFGLWLDPARLFSEEELALSRSTVEHAREEGAQP
jgi:hypothetical protein